MRSVLQSLPRPSRRVESARNQTEGTRLRGAVGFLDVSKHFFFSIIKYYRRSTRPIRLNYVLHLVPDVHLVELVDAADAVIGQHESTCLYAELSGLVILHHARCQTGGTRSLGWFASSTEGRGGGGGVIMISHPLKSRNGAHRIFAGRGLFGP